MYSEHVLDPDKSVAYSFAEGSMPLALGARRWDSWRNWITPAISVGVLAAALTELRSIDVRMMFASTPVSIGLLVALLARYLAAPICEWLIYRRLWALPVGALLPLLRKYISNEILLGYSGEVYFYAWARRSGAMLASPFGVIKNVAILSAQVGNVMTLVMLAIAWPMLGALRLGTHGFALVASCGLILLMSLPVMLFRRRLLTLPAKDIWAVAALHAVRIIATMFLAAWLWHEALPSVALSWWILMVAVRQLLSRLPLIPNKDVVFAGLSIFLIGAHSHIPTMIAMVATLTIGLHIVLGAALALADLLTPGKASR